MVKKEFLRCFFVQKVVLMIAGDKGPWGERAALLLYEAGGYVLRVQGGGDMQGVSDHKCLLRISTHENTFAGFLRCLSLGSILTISEMNRRS